MRKPLALGAASAAALLLAANGAQASGPAVTFDPTEFNIQAGATFSATPATLTTTNGAASGGFTPGGPEVSVSGTGPTNVSSAALWEFEVTGGLNNVLVPIVVTGSFDTSSTGGGIATGGVADGLFNSPLGYLQTVNCTGGAGDCGTTNFTIHTFALSNYLMQMLIVAGGAVSGPVGTFSSHTDPVISFDLSSGFDFSSYELQVAPDAQPGPGGVPEPATSALTILGFGAAGAALRRRRAPTVAG